MIDNVKNELLQYSHDCNKGIGEMSFLLALSGGIDSMVLSDLLIKLQKDYNYSLFFIHVNHNYNNLCNIMEKFVIEYSEKINVQLFIENISVSDTDNFESTSRVMRHKIFNNILSKYKIDNILTAHHQNDQIETIFMKIEDGADWISKVGIRRKNDKIRRPMLDMEKEKIMSYANINNIKWIDDPSNMDTSFRRNNVRLNKIPKILRKNQEFKSDILNISKKNEDKLKSIVDKIPTLKKQVVIKDDDEFILINKDEFLLFSLEEIKLFFYYYIEKKINYKIKVKSRSFWLQFIDFMNYGKTGKFFFIDELRILVNRNSLFVCKNTFITEIDREIRFKDKIDWHDTSFNVSEAFSLDFSNDKKIFIIPNEIYCSGLKLRTWRKGDRMISSNNGKNVLLSNLFVDNKLSFYEKQQQPVMTNSSDEIIWVPGLLHGKIPFLNSSNFKTIRWVCDG